MVMIRVRADSWSGCGKIICCFEEMALSLERFKVGIAFFDDHGIHLTMCQQIIQLAKFKQRHFVDVFSMGPNGTFVPIRKTSTRDFRQSQSR